jgi:predicted nucleic acid-binding Zn ribbon protein
MPDDKELTEEQEQLYRKARVPHKFCPYCGTRNEADADACVNCEKDISWMRIPEPVPYDTAPPKPPASLPEGERIFTPRTVIIFVLIILLIAALVVILALVSSRRGPESQVRLAARTPAVPIARALRSATVASPATRGGWIPGY